MTNESMFYVKVGREFGQHGIVTDSAGEHPRRNVTTNSVESSLCGTSDHFGSG